MGALGASLAVHDVLGNKSMLNNMKKPTAEDVNKYLRSLIDVQEPSVDKIIIGDPSTRVNKIGTAWMPYWETCKQAVSDGVNVLIVHEPTFYAHRDLEADEWLNIASPTDGQQKYLKLRKEKARWIKENGLVIIRCHDVWDKFPDIGIPYAFGQALGFPNDAILRREMYYNVYKSDPVPALEMARHIAEKLNVAGQPGVAFYGDEKYMVRSVGVGTGCICNPMNYMQLEPDLFIAIDDTVRTWIQTTYAEDTGKPLVVVNHGTSEEFGMKLLNEHLTGAFEDFEVIHYKQGCTYKWITA
jgi:putative NIF3 family GTP cyclohydrolase 1 type 2